MNTTTVVPITGKDVFNPLNHSYGSGVYTRLVLIYIPCLSSERTEVYAVTNERFFKIECSIERLVLNADGSTLAYEDVVGQMFAHDMLDIISVMPVDRTVPTDLQEELSRYADPRTLVYVLLTPGFGFGSAVVEMTMDLVPISVPLREALERPILKQQQKHVSKSYPTKQRSR